MSKQVSNNSHAIYNGKFKSDANYKFKSDANYKFESVINRNHIRIDL